LPRLDPPAKLREADAIRCLESLPLFAQRTALYPFYRDVRFDAFLKSGKESSVQNMFLFISE
jgi:hypothetical protein